MPRLLLRRDHQRVQRRFSCLRYPTSRSALNAPSAYTATGALKLIENQNGIAFIQTVQTLILRQGLDTLASIEGVRPDLRDVCLAGGHSRPGVRSVRWLNALVVERLRHLLKRHHGLVFEPPVDSASPGNIHRVAFHVGEPHVPRIEVTPIHL